MHIFVWASVLSIGVLLIAAIIVAPLARSAGQVGFANAIYKAFSFVCHQLPDRSFHLAAHKFAVCSRCTGLYTGFALAALTYPLVRPLQRTDTPSRVWLFVAAAPLAIDFGLGYFDVWQNTHASRFVTGALLSSVAVFYIIPGLVEIAGRMIQRLRSV